MKFKTLDILRGLAALWVFTFHFPFSPALEGKCPSLFAFFRHGHLGVPMFFVISGYCMMASARSTAGKGGTVGSFGYRRLRRIYPPFWLSVAVVVALPFVIEAISSLKSGTYAAPPPSYAQWGPTDWLRVLTLTQGLFPPDGDMQGAYSALNSVYWTLTIEVQFYLVMAAALAGGRWLGHILVGVTVVSIPLAFVPAAYGTGVFLPFWPMFALGLGLYAVLERGWTPERLFGRRALLFAGVLSAGGVGLGIAVLALDLFPVSHLTFALAFAPLAWLAFPLDRPLSELAVSGPAVVAWPLRGFLVAGAMSYSVYLLHAKLWGLPAQFVRQVIRADSVAFPILTMLGTLLLCYLFYRWCERPFVKVQSATESRPPPAALPSVLSGPVQPELVVSP